MVFSTRLPTGSLIDLCRSLRHQLGAGLSLRDVFQQQSRKGPTAVRPVAGRLSEQLGRGDGLEDALKGERGKFPPLFLAMASVGEQSGNLPEVFATLEKYFRMQQRLWRQFVAQSAWPVLQFVAAIFVIAGMIFLLGVVTPADQKPFDPLGLGLSGASGALTFLGAVAAVLAAAAAVYLVLTRGLRQRPAVDRFLLRVPALGPCLEALALARFCLGLRLTLESSMSVWKAARLSLQATGNAAYAAASPRVEEALRGGEEMTTALASTGLFPEEFRNIVAVAEESGLLPERMEHQSEHYQEEAGRRLTVLTVVAGFAVWLFVAVLIIYVIFRIVFSYLNLIDSMTRF